MAFTPFLYLALGVTIFSPGATGQSCHIPYGISPLAARNESAIRLDIPQVANIGMIKDYFFSVEACSPKLYILLEVTRTIRSVVEPFLSSFLGTSIGCTSRRNASVTAEATAVKLLRSHQAFDEVIPSSWRSESTATTAIIRLTLLTGFPDSYNFSYSCAIPLIENGIGVLLQKVGCPRGFWGADCSQSCACPNGGECHTFEGHCCETGVNSRCDSRGRSTLPKVDPSRPSKGGPPTPSTRGPLTTSPGDPPTPSKRGPLTPSKGDPPTSSKGGPSTSSAEGGDSSGFPVLFGDPSSMVLVILMGALAKLLNAG